MKRTKTKLTRHSVTYTFTREEVIAALEEKYSVELHHQSPIIRGYSENSGIAEEVSCTMHFDSVEDASDPELKFWSATDG